MDRKAEGRFQDLVAVEGRAVAQQQARDPARQLPGQLRPAAAHEQVDDREVEALAAARDQRLRSGMRDVDAVSLLPQHDRQGAAIFGVAVDQQYGSICEHAHTLARPVPASESLNLLCFREVRPASGSVGCPRIGLALD